MTEKYLKVGVTAYVGHDALVKRLTNLIDELFNLLSWGSVFGIEEVN